MKIRRYRAPRPAFVADNIYSMEQIMITCNIMNSQISAATGIPHNYISEYKQGIAIPSKSNYNKLAAFFDWEVWL